MTDGTHLESTEEAWIAKYRAALENVPAKESRFTKIRIMLGKLRRALSLPFDRALGRLKPEMQNPNTPAGPVVVAQAMPMQPLPAMRSSRRPTSIRRPAKKGSTTTRTLQTPTKRQVH